MKRNLTLLLFSILVYFIFSDFVGLPINQSLGTTGFFFILAKFFIDIGKKVVIKELMLVIAFLQWIIGPILAYRYFPDDEIYYMAVEQEEYFSFAISASFSFMVGVLFPLGIKIPNEENTIKRLLQFSDQNQKIGLRLIVIGVVFSFASVFFPASLRFLFFLVSSFKFIGLYYLILSNYRYKWYVALFILFEMLLSSVSAGMFHDLLLWGGFLTVILMLYLKLNSSVKFLVLGSGLIIIFLIQAVKSEYRTEIWEGEAAQFSDTQRGGLFYSKIMAKIQNPSLLFEEENLNAMVVRVNQGWIIARVLFFVPTGENFANGETIQNGIISGLVPRFLLPDKVQAGGEYFSRFTGRNLESGTSMNLSILGEAYANYGREGSFVFLFILGFFYNVTIDSIKKMAKRYPTLILWLPFVFLQVVKAETDFTTVFNHMIKASLVLFAYYLFNNKEESVYNSNTDYQGKVKEESQPGTTQLLS